MELSQLKYFLSVADTEHITQSAEQLHIAQPSLTKSLHNLETELGVPLLLHKGRNIVLSEYGRYLQRKLTPLIGELERLPEDLKRMAKLTTETVHINVLAISTLITDCIIEYKKLHENVQFQIYQNSDTEICDIKIETTAHTQPDTALEANREQRRFTVSERIFLAVPRDSAFQNERSISLFDVATDGFICLSGSRQFRSICDMYCKKIHFSPKIIFESDSPSSVMQAIASKLGVCFYPEFSWGKICNENIHLLEITDFNFRRNIELTANLNKSDNSTVLSFFAFVREKISAAAEQDPTLLGS